MIHEPTVEFLNRMAGDIELRYPDDAAARNAALKILLGNVADTLGYLLGAQGKDTFIHFVDRLTQSALARVDQESAS